MDEEDKEVVTRSRQNTLEEVETMYIHSSWAARLTPKSSFEDLRTKQS
jgi:hypothetical protein